MTTANTPSAARVPLMLGVTGHRNIADDDVGPLRRAVREIFWSLQREYPHTPLVLLSPLAEGADRLVAEVALEKGVDVGLTVVFPWPEDVCPHLLCRLNHKPTFDAILKSADQVVSLPLIDGTTDRELAASDEVRQRHYEQAGRFIARHSQILIALWDGYDSPESGTARVVRWQREGTTAPLAIRTSELDDVERGAVFHVVTPSFSRPWPQNALKVMPDWPAPPSAAAHGKPLWRRHRIARWLTRLEPLAVFLAWLSHDRQPGERQLRRTWRNLDRFNKDAEFVEKKRAAQLETNKAYLVPRKMQPYLPGDLAEMLEIYGRADTAAGRYQSHMFKTTSFLFIGAFVAVLALELYAHVRPTWWMLGAHLAVLLVGYIIYLAAQFWAYQPRYLDYRALAEALRVQIAWRGAGLADSVADHYLRHFRGEMDWIRLAARTCFLVSGSLRPPLPLPGRGGSLRPLRRVRKWWIEDQQTFFTRRVPLNEGQELLFKLATRYLFRLAVLLAISLVVIEYLTPIAGHASGRATGHAAADVIEQATGHATGHEEFPWMTAGMHHGLIVLLFCALVLSALFEDYANYAAYAIHSRKYHWMSGLYLTASEKLQTAIDAGDLTKARLIVWELGKEALAENADWVVQHRDRLPIWHSG